MFSPSLSVEAVTAFLRARLGDAGDVEPIVGGEWSRAFAFRTGEREYVIRFGRYGEDYAKDRVAAGFDAPDLPVPQIHEIGEAFDGAYAISTRAHGGAFDRLDEAGYRRVFPAVFRALDALRRVDTSRSSGYGYWRPDGSAPFPSWRDALLDVGNDRASGRIHGWRERLAAVAGAAATFGEGYRLLRAMVAVCPEDRHAIHTDLVGDNVLVLEGRVTAVVDWGNSMYGDFLYDLPRLTFWAPWFPQLARIDLRGMAREHYASTGRAVPDLDARLRCYEVHIGLDAQAYNAFTGRWDELERSGRRTLEVARAAS